MGERGGDAHVMMLAQGAQIFIQLFDALLVGLYAFFFEALVELVPVRVCLVLVHSLLDLGVQKTYAFPPHLFVFPLCFCLAAAGLVVFVLVPNTSRFTCCSCGALFRAWVFVR